MIVLSPVEMISKISDESGVNIDRLSWTEARFDHDDLLVKKWIKLDGHRLKTPFLIELAMDNWAFGKEAELEENFESFIRDITEEIRCMTT